MGELEDLVLKTVEIPSVPKALLQLQEVVSNPRSSIKDAVSVVEEDSGLATRCLKLANSALYGLRTPCSTLQHASSLLGMNKLRELAVQTGLVAQYAHLRKQYGFNMERFWQHGAVASVAAREIAKKSRLFRGVDGDVAASCGLLHNIGRLAMIDAFRASYLSVVLPLGGHGDAALRAEEEAFGFNHAVVGGLLAEKWKLAPEIVEAARGHHAAGQPPASLASLTGFASNLAHALLDSGDKQVLTIFQSPAAEPYRLELGSELDMLRSIKVGAQAATAVFNG